MSQPALRGAAITRRPHLLLRRARRRCALAIASQGAHAQSRAPWAVTFDLRERDTEWSEENKARLIAILTARELALSTEATSEALESLMLVLPDLSVARLKPTLLAQLVRDLPRLAQRMLMLKELLPGADVSRMVSGRPQLLLQPLEQLKATAGELQGLFKDEAAVARLVEQQPMAMEPGCVQAVLEEMRRLLPANADVTALLASSPEWLLRAQSGQRWLGEHPDSDGQEIKLRY